MLRKIARIWRKVCRGHPPGRTLSNGELFTTRQSNSERIDRTLLSMTNAAVRGRWLEFGFDIRFAQEDSIARRVPPADAA
jgi:hypothetical protein